MKVHSTSVIFLILILISSSLTGCFGGEEEGEYSGPINLNIGVAETSGMIEISKGQNNQTISESYATFEFDFTQVNSEGSNIEEIMLLPDDGSDPIIQNPADNAVISYEYTTHGIFDITLGAMDEKGNAHTKKMKLRVDYLLWSNITNTDNENIWVDTTPGSNTSVAPSRIHVVSDVTNPGGFGFLGAGPSDVTFKLIDEAGNEVSSNTETVADGGSTQWETEYPNPNAGTWKMEYMAEGDNVDSNTVVMVHYPEEESEPVELDSSMSENESEN